jgi:histone H3/H4
VAKKARNLSRHAKRKKISKADVMLAIDSY